MAEMVRVAGGAVTAGAERPLRWSRSRALIIGTVATFFAVWCIVSPNLISVLGCLGATLVFASRSWPKANQMMLFGLLPNAFIWGGFLKLRGFGDESPWTASVQLVVRRFEVWLFGGELPSSMLQRHLLNPNDLRALDYLSFAVDAAFFLLPTLSMVYLWWSDRLRYPRAMTAFVLVLGAGIVLFALLPTNPPWMNPATDDPNPVPVYRVSALIGERFGTATFEGDGSLATETNSLAAMPSIHMAVTFLVVLVWWGRRRLAVLAMLNSAAMAFALVYLGEHHVLDEVAGVVLTLLAWKYSPGVLAWGERVVGVRLTSAWAGAGERLPAQLNGGRTRTNPAE
jgi:hypothetical protein